MTQMLEKWQNFETEEDTGKVLHIGINLNFLESCKIHETHIEYWKLP